MKKIQERWRGADINYEWELREVFKDVIEHAYFNSKGKLSKSVIRNAFEEAMEDIVQGDPEYFSFYDDLNLTESKKKFQEDSLDDWDIDGKIAKDRASQPEAIKAFVKKFQESVWTVFSQGVSVSMEYAGLEYSKYTHKNTFCVYGDNSFGLNYKPGCDHRYEIVLGEYGYVMWNGQLYSSDGPNSYHTDAKHIEEVAEKIRQDIYQCVKDQWDAYKMTSKWNISFEDCFKIGSIVKSATGGINSGAFYFKCSFKIPELTTLTENTLNEDVEALNKRVIQGVIPYCEDDFDFTNFDIDEDTFDKLVADFNAMRVDQEELDTLGLRIENSLHGPYGIYASGNGIPDIVLNDAETPLGARPYRYTISIYQTQEDSNELYNDVYEYLLQKMGE